MMPKLEKIERAVSQKRINLTNDDVNLIVELSRKHSLETKPSIKETGVDALTVKLSKGSTLDRSPKKNWVEREGGLPKKIEDLAKALVRSGHTIQNAIQIAVGKAKVFAVTVDNPAKRAEWAAAVAQWEKMKVSSKAKTAAKKASKNK